MTMPTYEDGRQMDNVWPDKISDEEEGLKELKKKNRNFESNIELEILGMKQWTHCRIEGVKGKFHEVLRIMCVGQEPVEEIELSRVTCSRVRDKSIISDGEGGAGEQMKLVCKGI